MGDRAPEPARRRICRDRRCADPLCLCACWPRCRSAADRLHSWSQRQSEGSDAAAPPAARRPGSASLLRPSGPRLVDTRQFRQRDAERPGPYDRRSDGSFGHSGCHHRGSFLRRFHRHRHGLDPEGPYARAGIPVGGNASLGRRPNLLVLSPDHNAGSWLAVFAGSFIAGRARSHGGRHRLRLRAESPCRRATPSRPQFRWC